MPHVHRVKIRTIKRRLGPRGRLELVSDDGYRGQSQILQIYRVVQTARCTRPSIGQRLDNSVDGAKLFHNAGWGRLRKRWFRRAHNVCHLKSFAEQSLQSIEEEVAADDGGLRIGPGAKHFTPLNERSLVTDGELLQNCLVPFRAGIF